MADYLKRIQDGKESLGLRLQGIRKANNISMESVERIFPLETATAIEAGITISDNGEVITIDALLGYCDLIGASLGPYNKTPEE